MNAESGENAVSIPDAAKQLGLDSFTLYGLIQADKVRPKRARWGELLILQIELDRVLKKSAPSSDGQSQGR